uniref:NADAR domain-containing protein n=1 Tax=Setaria digitata TaxID=48799 RepID=A0A915PGE3_9BILA
MSTPASIKAMELAREKAARRYRQSDTAGLVPLTQPWPSRGYYYGGYRGRNIDFTADKAGGKQYTSFEGGRKEIEPRTPPKPLTPPPVEDVPIDVDTDDYKVDADEVICFSGRQHFLSNLYPGEQDIFLCPTSRLFLDVVLFRVLGRGVVFLPTTTNVCSANEVTLTVDGHDYPSVEHYYQACKLYTLGGARLAAQLRHIPDAGQVKTYTKKLLRSASVSLDKVEEWKRTQGPVLLHHAIVHKFVQNPELRVKLLETGAALLAHTYERDNIFATGCDKEKMIEWAKNNNGQIIKIPTKIDNGTLVYIPLVGEGKNILGFINMKVRQQLLQFKATQATQPPLTDPIMMVAMQTLKLDSPTKAESMTN